MAGGHDEKKPIWKHILTLYSHSTGHAFAKWLEAWKLEPVIFSTAWLILLVIIASVIDPESISGVLSMITLLSPIWLPLYLGTMLWIVWIDYIRFLFWFADPKVLLEIELPPEVEKSPLAMEVVFSGIWNNGRETTFLDRMWKGRFRPIWSFEIASNEGRINFYIHAPRGWKNFIEARIYGQYPEARITPVDDYVDRVPFNLREWDMWVGEYKKVNSPQALPIKVAADFELDKNTDVPETKVDPMTNLLELMNNMGKDQYLWCQFIVKARQKDEWYGVYLPKDSFIDGANERIKKIIAGAADRARDIARVELHADELQQAQIAGRGMSMLTDGEKKEIEAIDHTKGKAIFEVGARIVYVAKKEKFFGLTGGPLYRAFEAYKSDFNDFKGTRGMVGFDYPWEDFRGIRKARLKRDQFFFYKNRAYFYVPYDQAPVFMTTEELASLWHFPNSAVKTPGLERVASKRGEAPANLPILPS
ncbi:hypothetical protein H7X87_02150 [Acetobacteraceae bacterium]|nr:hypothetical protein [Candidatus Parcubacteria bacterium]